MVNCSDNVELVLNSNISLLYELHILIPFSAEFNSNWGRLLRSMRVRLTPLTHLLAHSESNAKVRGRVDTTNYTMTLDFRVAWGSSEQNLPGM